MILNGFEVEKFNQYNLPDKARMSTCPLCSSHRKPENQKSKCLMLDWETGLGTCQHCGEVIQLHTYKRLRKEKIYSKPVWKNNTELSERLVRWFEGRKISQNTLTKMKITEGKEWMPQAGKEVNTVQFNYFRDYELVNVKYRDGAKNFKMFKDAERIFYNLDNIRTTKDVIIAEGEMDALSYFECGFWNATSVPNGSTKGNVNLDYLDNCYEYFENKDRIYLSLDNDEAGQNTQKELVRRLGAERCFLIRLNECKDANEFLQKYGKELLREAVLNAEPCPLEHVQTLVDVRESLHEFYLNGMKKGFQIGLRKFDETFSTYTSQYIVVTGMPSSGKSDFVDQMCVGYNMNYGWKTGYCSPENKPTVLHIDKIARKFYGNKPADRQTLNSLAWKAVEDRVNENFFFIDDESYDLKKALDKGEELVKRKGIKCLVLDPYNKIPLREARNKNVNEYTTDYLIEIDNFCRKYDVLVILVAHPRKVEKEGGKRMEPDFYDVKGGGEFYDMSYHGLLVHRNYTNNTVKIKVLKCKFQHLGTNQAESFFTWSPTSGRYTDFIGTPDMAEVTPIWDNTNWALPKPEIQQQFQYHPDSRIEPDEDFYTNCKDDIPF